MPDEASKRQRWRDVRFQLKAVDIQASLGIVVWIQTPGQRRTRGCLRTEDVERAEQLGVRRLRPIQTGRQRS
jgi:hypothetical protein